MKKIICKLLCFVSLGTICLNICGDNCCVKKK